MASGEFELKGEVALRRKFRRVPALLQGRVARAALTESALYVQDKLIRNVSGRFLKVRTGRLRSSISHRVSRSGGAMEARVGPHVPYARIHEFGGTIKPKRVKNLTIPLRAVLTPAGVARFTARKIIQNPRIGGYDKTFFRKKVLFGVRDGRVFPLFALVKMVRIRPKKFMRITLQESRARVMQIMNQHVTRALRQA